VTVSKVFCNIPWTEVHINADGSYHSCGAQPNTITRTPEAAKYNVHTMSIEDWVNSEHQRNARLNKLAGNSEPLCAMCYKEEELGSSSKRLKENLKSGIHPIKFEESFARSPDYAAFKYSADNLGHSTMRPNSFHISLGNECNLACRMCTPMASSKIAVEQIKQGLFSGSARMNWTDDNTAWENVVNYVCSTPNLEFVHLIGGEPLLNPKFEELIDRLLLAGKTDIYLGFTTNGTVVNVPLIEKLNAFRHVDIGVSVECMGPLNDYIRRGSNYETVLNNIETYLKHRKEAHVYVTVRPVPSALSVHTLDELYRWCVDRKVDVMTNILVRPAFMQIQNLPEDIKHRLLIQYKHWQFSEPFPGPSNPRDPNRFKEHIDSEIKAIIKALQEPSNEHYTNELYEKLSLWHWLDQDDIAKYFETITKA
jgi:sulfatase maturation enzyme AslB (radical SAM superfamily)